MSGPDRERVRAEPLGPVVRARVPAPLGDCHGEHDHALGEGALVEAAPESNRLGPLAGPVRVAFGLYRAGISPLLGPSCRYHPTCSAYAETALTRFGLVRGLLLTLWRLLRCHPFARGGFDPVPARAARGVSPRDLSPRVGGQAQPPELANRPGH